MKASETYEFVKSLVRKAELDLDTDTLVSTFKELDWQVSGEFNYMKMDVQKVEPDVSKIQVQLIQGNTVIEKLNVRVDG